MYLCDVGNTNATICHNSKIWQIAVDKFDSFKTNDMVFYINVNSHLKDKLQKKKNFINLEKYFNFHTKYIGLGVDRVAACYSIKNGLIIDAGSAITFDIMSNGVHKGGFIMAGISHMKRAYKEISNVLDIDVSLHVKLHEVTQNTVDAVNYGILKPIVLMIKSHSMDKDIYFTGGDGEFLSKYFPNSLYKKNLLFEGMMKAIKENNLINKEKVC